jgi:amidophosphoribosyltransferase
MSDPIKHECGIAVVRLKKPLAYYHESGKGALYGLRLLESLMTKQRNRGQDGVGIGCVKLGMPAGQSYMFRVREMVSADRIDEVFAEEMKEFKRIARRIEKERKHERNEYGVEYVPFEEDPDAIKHEFDLAGEIYLGHLRYGTSGEFGKGSLHPYLRRSTWPTRSLMVMGNFNLTNTDELNQIMMERGQHPVFGTDTQSVLEEIGFQLDEAHTHLYHELKKARVDGLEIPHHISRQLDVVDVIKKSSEQWDGGYTIVGTIGNGDLFMMRDPHGIRPCYYYEDADMFVAASERVALMSVLEKEAHEIQELPAAHVYVMKADGHTEIKEFTKALEPKPCSFERIYFSRGNDHVMYQQRKQLGRALVPELTKVIGYDYENTVLSFIPNTAETAYYGLLDEVRVVRRKEMQRCLVEHLKEGTLTEEKIEELVMRNAPRPEKIAHKDIKMRTFIAHESGRDKMVSSVYDVTYGVVTDKDTLVVLDDSIVRGTTLKLSLLRILARTHPRRIVVVSTAPQIRYPDCYGIDMAELGKFIAFQAAISLLKERGLTRIISETQQRAMEELKKPKETMVNAVKAIYEPFKDHEISDKVAELIYPENTSWRGEVKVIYQTISGLHQALGMESGDWYFSGDYPTPGGFAVVNRSFLNFMRGHEGRAYGEALL